MAEIHRGSYSPEVVQEIIARTASVYQTEIARRHLVQKQVRMFHVSATAAAPAMAGGTVLVLTGTPNSMHFAPILRAAESGDAVKVSQAVTEYQRYVASGKGSVDIRPNAQLTAARIAAVPVLHQVTYRGRIIADGLPVESRHDLSLARLPYTGARLDPEGFYVNEFHATQKGLRTQTIVIAREPVLTGVERNILAKIPPDLAQVGLGSPGDVENWGLLAAGIVLAAVYFVGTYLAQKAQQDMQKQQQDAQKQMEQNLNQQDQGQQQQDQGQQQQDQGQQDQQDQGQQDQQDQGQGDQHANSGDLSHWLDGTELGTELQNMAALAAVEELLQLRSQLLITGRIG